MLCACTEMLCSGSRSSRVFLNSSGSPPPAQCACRLSLAAGHSVKPLPRGAVLMAVARSLRGLEVPDRRCGSGAGCRRQCGRENESRSVKAHRIDDVGARRDVTAERLRQCTLDHAPRVRRSHARRCGRQQGRTCLPNEPNRSHCAIAPRDRRCGSLKRCRCPRVESLQQDQLRPLGGLPPSSMWPTSSCRQVLFFTPACRTRSMIELLF